jgi:hypothetical protein
MKFHPSLKCLSKGVSPHVPQNGAPRKQTSRRGAEGGVNLLYLSFAKFAKQVLMRGANACSCITTSCVAQHKSITLRIYCRNCGDVSDRTHFDWQPKLTNSIVI